MLQTGYHLIFSEIDYSRANHHQCVEDHIIGKGHFISELVREDRITMSMSSCPIATPCIGEVV
jgi:hypothetical protein